MPCATRLSGYKTPSPKLSLPPFFRIPRKRVLHPLPCLALIGVGVPPAGGSLEIGNG